MNTNVTEFCRQCSKPLAQQVPEGDDRERGVCTDCGFIQYDNPKNIVGCLLEWQGKVLLCRRAIEPRHGYWTLPAGFMENNETTLDGAAREAYEEARAECDKLRLFGVYNLPRISQVYLMFIGRLRNGFAEAGYESLEVKLFKEDEIPWKELAFPVVTETLNRYYEMCEARTVQVHYADILSRPGEPLNIQRLI
ncbi:MAG: NUDIX hydrolase [Granulosicoccaceae bacterium]